MKKNVLHIVIGTIICASTMFVFLTFNNRLPEQVPVQITMDGSAGNSLPKPLLMFGLPLIFVVVNLAKSFSLAKNENASAFAYYIIPGIATLLAAATLGLALSI